MKKEQLMADLRLKLRQWQRWCSALEISASKPQYGEEEIKRLQELRSRLDEGEKYEAIVADMTGKPLPRQSEGNYREALVSRYGGKLEQEAKTVGNALAQAFDSMVWAEFVGALNNSKPKNFEKALEDYSVSNNVEVLDCEIVGALEGGDDDAE